MDNNTVVIERLFDAPAALIWAIWTKPEFIERWFGSDPEGTVLSANVDLTLGGNYRIAFRDSDGSRHAAFGEYLELVEGSRLRYSWEWESEIGHVTEMLVEFVPEGEKTRLILAHSKLNPNSAHGYRAGWNATMDKIEKLLKK